MHPSTDGTTAAVLRPAQRTYAGQITRPHRWALYAPRAGDILVSTPAKCGTTWTQSILAMLLHGGPDLPLPVPVISPWVDADLGISEDDVRDALAVQAGRRVIKTHTPLDGVAEWDGVRVITVYRHPLDVFFSLRKHYLNMTIAKPDDSMLRPEPEALDAFLRDAMDREMYSSKTLDAVVVHYRKTLESDRAVRPAMFHYSDMVADHRGAVVRLAQAAEIDASEAVIDAVTEATAFGAMKANPEAFAPAAGTGLFHSDAAFFDSGQSQKWAGRGSAEALALFDARITELLPDQAERDWLLSGASAGGGA